MKPVEQMTSEELTDLLFYEHTNGTKIALSKIKAIRPTSIDVEGYSASTTISPEVYSTLMDKMLVYETYKLSGIRENLLKVQEQQLESTFSKAFENAISSLASTVSNKLDYLDNIKQTVTNVESILANTTSAIDNTSKAFVKEVSNLNLDSINHQISSKLKTFSNYLDNLEDPTIEINKMSKLLREIFSEELVDKREP